MAWQANVAEAAAAKASATPVNASGKGDESWIHIQKKTFTNWVNTQLAEVGGKIDSLEEDLKSGVNLILTLEVCSKKSLGRYTKLPKIPTHALENLTLALKFLEKEGLKLVNIGPQDIHAGNLKLILGLIWTIIYHFQVSKSFKEASAAGNKKGTAKDLLLEWVRATIPEYKINNFNKDWNDGRALCALANAVGGEPWLLPNHNQLPPGAGPRNCKVGIDAAYDNFKIPRLVAPEDMADPAVDDLSMVTYISYFREAKRGGPDAAAAAADPAPVAEPVAAPAQRLQGPAERKASAAAIPAPAATSAAAKLPPPWQRPADWRKYEGPDLGGRCKIRVFFSSTTSSHEIRKNTKDLMNLLERENVHKRPDFEPWIPIDVDMPTEKRNLIFEKAKTKVTPMLFIDDEYIGDWKKVEELNESGELHRLLEY